MGEAVCPDVIALCNAFKVRPDLFCFSRSFCLMTILASFFFKTRYITRQSLNIAGQGGAGGMAGGRTPYRQGMTPNPAYARTPAYAGGQTPAWGNQWGMGGQTVAGGYR
jgi:hypothetical protein